MLRLIVLILLLLNFGYFVYGGGWLLTFGLGPTPQREPQRLGQQIHPEAIVILNERESAHAPVHQIATSASGDAACLQSNTLNKDQILALSPVLTTHLGESAWSLHEQVIPGRWIIYLGPFESPSERARKRTLLNELKITFNPVGVPELSPGFSLGAFTTQAETEKALQELINVGVLTAKMKQVQAVSSSYRLRLPAVDSGPLTQQALQMLKGAVPNMVLQPCAKPTTN